MREAAAAQVPAYFAQIEQKGPGMIVDEARKQVDVSSFRPSMTGGDPFRARAFAAHGLHPSAYSCGPTPEF